MSGLIGGSINQAVRQRAEAHELTSAYTCHHESYWRLSFMRVTIVHLLTSFERLQQAEFRHLTSEPG